MGIQKKSPVTCNSDGSLCAFGVCIIGRFFFVNGNFEICVYKLDQEKFRILRFLKGHSQSVFQMIYNEDLYYLFSCGLDGLFLWDLKNEECEPIRL